MFESEATFEAIMATMNDEYVKKIRELNESNYAAFLLFSAMESDQVSSPVSDIDEIINELSRVKMLNKDGKIDDIISYKISRKEMIHLARDLEAHGCGQFLVGRHGWPSRIQWNFQCKSIGYVAKSKSEKLIFKYADRFNMAPVNDITQNSNVGSNITFLKLTIPEAKKALARTLGISESDIEISIKA